ncbi:unnamed protein product [Phytophthora fragariaefolia]|uniref:Unnamed protein product n=1 Tax=Phytophthora fragariaefolia TaxID=1490495 RepID=A0A9W6Y7G0_9STRA|nr:unnamed protein product [Phytophthora fragariaefolia]
MTHAPNSPTAGVLASRLWKRLSDSVRDELAQSAQLGQTPGDYREAPERTPGRRASALASPTNERSAEDPGRSTKTPYAMPKPSSFMRGAAATGAAGEAVPTDREVPEEAAEAAKSTTACDSGNQEQRNDK